MPNMEEVAKVTQLLQQQVAELQAELLRAQAAAKQAGPNMKKNISQKAGKPSDYDGRQANWNAWALRPKCHFGGIYAGAEEFMEWAATRSDEIKGAAWGPTTTQRRRK